MKQDNCHFLVMDKLGFADSINEMEKKRIFKIAKFMETIPLFASLGRIPLEQFCR
jgi:hypothetical protein